MQVRQATERYRRADFAVRYWRSAPGPVMRIAEQALDAGVPMHAIRLLVLNTDLRIRGGQVYLRRPFIVTVLNIVFVRPKYALDVMRDFRASLKTVRIPKLLKPKQFNSSSAYSAPKFAKLHKLSSNQ